MTTLTEKIANHVESNIIMADCVDCFAVPGSGNIIDMVHPATGKTVIYGKTLEECRKEKNYEKAERMTIDEWCKAKAARQDTLIEWHEITGEKYSYYLEVLPPINWRNGAFLVGEPSDHHAITGWPRYQACKQVGDKFYASNRPLTRIELTNELSA